MSNQFWHMASIEPKRQFRWVATIGDGANLHSYVVKKVARPEWTTTEKEHKILGHTFYYPGPVTWNTIDVSVVDIAGNQNDPAHDNAVVYLQELIFASGYAFPTGINDARASGVTKANAVGALNGLFVKQLDSQGNELERYTFNNPFIQKINFGPEFDYESDNILDVTFTVRYDWAEVVVGPAKDNS
tara:strand:- start:1736 stop:2296 length:561 start_codon:yes stop_codon:yes gene_type:complete